MNASLVMTAIAVRSVRGPRMGRIPVFELTGLDAVVGVPLDVVPRSWI